MARFKQPKKDTWLGFFNYFLDEGDRTAIRAFMGDKKKPSLDALLMEMVSNRYKVTVSINDSTGACICSVTGKHGCMNEGYTLSVTHASMDTTVYAAWFVIAERFNWDQWPVDQNEVPNW